METNDTIDGYRPSHVGIVLLVSHLQQYRYVPAVAAYPYRYHYTYTALTSFTYLALFNVGK